MTCDHPQPCTADLYAAAVLTRNVLAGASHAEGHALADGTYGTCTACIAVAAGDWAPPWRRPPPGTRRSCLSRSASPCWPWSTPRWPS